MASVHHSQPPFYILFSHSSLSNAAPNVLGHPAIEYHYADDSPLSLLPHHPDEHVLVMDFEAASTSPPTVKSLSKTIAVTGLKLEEAPGAAAEEGDVKRNDRMHIIDTVTAEERPFGSSEGERKSPQAILAQFKQRNVILRRALVHPDASKGTVNAHTPLPPSPLRSDS